MAGGSITPPDGPVTPEGTARRLDQLGALLRRAGDVCVSVASLVRQGGFDPHTCEVMEEAAEHLEDMDDVSAGTALTLRRLLTQQRKDRT
jgi:hypothetical protein